VKVLALDTATAACSVAVRRDGALIGHRFVAMRRGHAEALMPMVAAVMDEAGLAFRALDLVATTVGPGTFTGLRVGLAAARAIGLAAAKPVAGVGTLEAIAHAHGPPDRGVLAAVLAARRGEVYLQIFDRALAPLGPPAVLAPEAAVLPGSVIAVGDGAGVLRAAHPGVVLGEAPPLPDAATVAALAAALAARDGLPDHPPHPLYVRPPGARPPKPGR